MRTTTQKLPDNDKCEGTPAEWWKEKPLYQRKFYTSSSEIGPPLPERNRDKDPALAMCLLAGDRQKRELIVKQKTQVLVLSLSLEAESPYTTDAFVLDTVDCYDRLIAILTQRPDSNLSLIHI